MVTNPSEQKFKDFLRTQLAPSALIKDWTERAGLPDFYVQVKQENFYIELKKHEVKSRLTKRNFGDVTTNLEIPKESSLRAAIISNLGNINKKFESALQKYGAGKNMLAIYSNAGIRNTKVNLDFWVRDVNALKIISKDKLVAHTFADPDFNNAIIGSNIDCIICLNEKNKISDCLFKESPLEKIWLNLFEQLFGIKNLSMGK